MSAPIHVVAAAIVHEGRVLAARRRPELARGDLWELPGGKVEAGETEAEALEREIREELELTVRAEARLDEAVHDYGDVRIRLVAWRCTWCGGEPALRDHAEVAWVGADALHTLRWAPADVPLLEAVRALLR